MISKIFGIKNVRSAFYWMLVALLIQQLIAATSSIWIVEFVRIVKDSGAWRLPFVLFLLSMILPYLPGALALHFMNIWNFQAQRDAVELYVKNTVGRVELYSNQNLKSKQIVQMSKDVPQFINELTQFSYNFLSIILNFSLQVMAVGFILGLHFTMSFLVGISLMVIYIFMATRRNKSLSMEKQKAISLLATEVGASWENLTLANKHNLGIWSNCLKNCLALLQNATKRSSFAKEFGGALISIIGFMPVLLYFYLTILSGGPTVYDLLTTSVLMPRIFQIFNSCTTLILTINHVSFVRGQWEALKSSFDDLENCKDDLASRIIFSEMNVRNNETAETFKLNSMDELLALLDTAQSGWYTIMGPNGCGKSTMLLYLKRLCGSTGFYLPTNFSLKFLSLEGKKYSTGQKAAYALTEIATIKGIKTLMLDEWDANLDQSVIVKIKDILAQMSKQMLVIDVSHRQ